LWDDNPEKRMDTAQLLEDIIALEATYESHKSQWDSLRVHPSTSTPSLAPSTLTSSIPTLNIAEVDNISTQHLSEKHNGTEKMEPRISLDIPSDVVSRRLSEETLPLRRKSDNISQFKTPGNEVQTSPDLKSPRNRRQKSGSPRPKRSPRRSQKSTETSPRVQKSKAEV